MGESTHYPIKNLINKWEGGTLAARFSGAFAPENRAQKSSPPLGAGLGVGVSGDKPRVSLV